MKTFHPRRRHHHLHCCHHFKELHRLIQLTLLVLHFLQLRHFFIRGGNTLGFALSFIGASLVPWSPREDLSISNETY